MEGGAWSRRSSINDEDKFREAMGMACNFLQVEEMYPDQEKTLKSILKGNDIFFSSHKIYFRPIIRLKQKYDKFTK